MDENGLVLTVATGAVDRLILDGRDRPRIVEDHRVGTGEIEPDSAGLDADEKDACAAILKIITLSRSYS